MYTKHETYFLPRTYQLYSEVLVSGVINLLTWPNFQNASSLTHTHIKLHVPTKSFPEGSLYWPILKYSPAILKTLNLILNNVAGKI